MPAYRFSSTIQGLGKPFKGSSGGPPHRKSQEKGSSRNSLVGCHSKKASLGKEGQQVLMDSRPSHASSAHSSEGICHYISRH